MKLIARIFALSLVATGAFASAHLADAAKPAVFMKASAMPIPVCPPGNTGCGMGGPGTN